MEMMNNKRFDPANVCIYCGSTETLSDEHIIPLGLSGTIVLPKASCGVCAAITSKIECSVLRSSLRSVRAFRGLKTRRKKDMPQTDVMSIIKDGNREEVELPISEYPNLFPFPLFPHPGCFSEEVKSEGMRLVGTQTILFGPTPDIVAANLGSEKVLIERSVPPVEFARMIGKIALGVYAAANGPSTVIGSPLANVVLGHDLHVGQWIGTQAWSHESDSGMLHKLLIVSDHERNADYVIVRLFADSETPSYMAVIRKY